MHQNKTISERISGILCNTDDYECMHQNKAISEQSSKFLCNIKDLCSYASKQSNFRTRF